MSGESVTRLLVVLDVKGNPEDAMQVVNGLLDCGAIQDSINDHDSDCGALRVKDAKVVRPLQRAQENLLRRLLAEIEEATAKPGWPWMQPLTAEEIAALRKACSIVTRPSIVRKR
jgi:hypothetical protein